MLTDDRAIEFDWDNGNIGKNKKHRVEDSEGEEVFFDAGKVILGPTLHVSEEERFILLGKTKMGRLLFVVFSRRESKFRIISARDINRKERHLYEKKAEDSEI